MVKQNLMWACLKNDSPNWKSGYLMSSCPVTDAPRLGGLNDRHLLFFLFCGGDACLLVGWLQAGLGLASAGLPFTWSSSLQQGEFPKREQRVAKASWLTLGEGTLSPLPHILLVTASHTASLESRVGK